jgi:hypothetical protein
MAYCLLFLLFPCMRLNWLGRSSASHINFVIRLPQTRLRVKRTAMIGLHRRRTLKTDQCFGPKSSSLSSGSEAHPHGSSVAPEVRTRRGFFVTGVEGGSASEAASGVRKTRRQRRRIWISPRAAMIGAEALDCDLVFAADRCHSPDTVSRTFRPLR